MRTLLIVLCAILLVACAGRGDATVPTAISLALTATVAPSVTSSPLAMDTPQPALTTPTLASQSTQGELASPTVLIPTAGSGLLSVSEFPDPAAYTWQPVVSGLQSPIGLANAGDGSGRLFVIEQPGRVRTVQGGLLSPDSFLDITDRVGSQGFEQGLLGLAFHPDYAENGYLFVNYTDLQGNTVIARFARSTGDANRADPSSEVRLLQISQPYANHNGGMVAFGPDGYLYLGLGDGGAAGDPQENAQSLGTLLGKILRIDVDNGQTYGIPSDNPFANGGGLPEIWAYGLRNPWRFAFDRLTGDLYIGDVGQNEWEEINFLPASSPGGVNFGWKYLEGTHPFQGQPPVGLDLLPPVAEYRHDLGCSVTGGVVYRGSRLPTWQGVYLYGDYCTGRIWGLLRDAQRDWRSVVLFESMGRITSFGEDEAGEIFLADQAGGIYLLTER